MGRSRSRSYDRGNYGPPSGMNGDYRRNAGPGPINDYHDRGYYGDRGHGRNQPYGGDRGGPPPQQSKGAPGGERRRGRRDDTPPGVSLLVRNLSTEITLADLQAAFRRIGEIKDVYIPLDYHSKQPKGFAFIEYATQAQARAAKDEMNHFLMKGRELEVVFAQEKRKTPGEMKIRTDSPERDQSTFNRSSSFERQRFDRDRDRGGDQRRRPEGRSGSRDQW